MRRNEISLVITVKWLHLFKSAHIIGQKSGKTKVGMNSLYRYNNSSTNYKKLHELNVCKIVFFPE